MTRQAGEGCPCGVVPCAQVKVLASVQSCTLHASDQRRRFDALADLLVDLAQADLELRGLVRRPPP